MEITQINGNKRFMLVFNMCKALNIVYKYAKIGRVNNIAWRSEHRTQFRLKRARFPWLPGHFLIEAL